MNLLGTLRRRIAPLEMGAPEDMGKAARACVGYARQPSLRIAVVGVALTDRANLASHLAMRFSESRHHRVSQTWVELGAGPNKINNSDARILRYDPAPKFALLNRALRHVDLSQIDMLIVSDDDISVQAGFLDAYVSWVQYFKLALAQPARTSNSFTDHRFVLQRSRDFVRRTRFVEIGPLFSVAKSAFLSLLPFDETSPMGWGYDLIWPCVMASEGLHMGIVDAVPVEHSLRPQGVLYDRANQERSMRAILSTRRHLEWRDAMKVLRRHWVDFS